MRNAEEKVKMDICRSQKRLKGKIFLPTIPVCTGGRVQF